MINLPHQIEAIIPHQTLINLSDAQTKSIEDTYTSLRKNYDGIAFVTVSKPRGVLYLEATTSEPGKLYPPRYAVTVAPDGSFSHSRIE